MLTPRECLSWSSMDLLERNVEKWKETYFENKKRGINRGEAFGKAMANGLENDEETGDAVLDLVISQIPKFELMDIAFTAEIKDKAGNIPVLAKPDTYKADYSAFKEYKTSQSAWTQKKVDTFGQITFYATVCFLKTGKIPHDIELVHVLTEKEDPERLESKIRATGEIKRYYTHRKMSDILNMMVRMKKAWRLIEKICEEELI